MFKRNKKLAESDAIHAPDGIEPMNLAGLQSETTALAAIAKLFDVYQPGVVFSEPSTVGDHSVITAAEVHVGLGLGFGHGSGGPKESGGEGGGGGGGGASTGRPVAAIIISPKGVQVEPIVDVTKIALAFFTTIGAMFMAWRAMRRIK
jgi:uncharacterized spore protein YtfJ